jgi:hypothetical protein
MRHALRSSDFREAAGKIIAQQQAMCAAAAVHNKLLAAAGSSSMLRHWWQLIVARRCNTKCMCRSCQHRRSRSHKSKCIYVTD